MESITGAYKGRRVLLTGHTGFKGSWLCLWLKMMGAEVSALALSPNSTPSHWDLLNLDIRQEIIDIRDGESVRQYIMKVQPEIVFHLAAQPLVLRSYEDPLETWQTNVMGTANVLNSLRYVQSLKAAVIISTDKCYENMEHGDGYVEEDKLGGHDPYSASKAAVEILTSSYRRSFFNRPDSPLIASARAGNVIGGGDWAENRLIPDVCRSIRADAVMEVRHPESTRPWQHVLDCLSGYMLLGAKLLAGANDCACAWNFGPSKDSNQTVAKILDEFALLWPEFRWKHVKSQTAHEAQLLYLDSSRARNILKWKPVWNWKQAIKMSVDWNKAWILQGKVISEEQIKIYQIESGMGA